MLQKKTLPECDRCILNLTPSESQLSSYFLQPSSTQPSEPQAPIAFSIAAIESLGLTKREAEVLFWIAKDKSNAGIAKAIGCCEGTVRKHLENLYKKLGVQTRLGAVMTTLEKLGLLNH